MFYDDEAEELLWFYDETAPPPRGSDNDDGSTFYNTHHNFFPFSVGGLKSDFGVDDNHQHNNLYINKGGCMGICAQKPGHEDAFYNNVRTVVSRRSGQLPLKLLLLQTCTLTEAGGSYASFSTGANSGGVGDPYRNFPRTVPKRPFLACRDPSPGFWSLLYMSLHTTVDRGSIPAAIFDASMNVQFS